jgi:hypothetical protein
MKASPEMNKNESRRKISEPVTVSHISDSVFGRHCKRAGCCGRGAALFPSHICLFTRINPSNVVMLSADTRQPTNSVLVSPFLTNRELRAELESPRSSRLITNSIRRANCAPILTSNSPLVTFRAGRSLKWALPLI